jgi:hypothetical protein
MMYDPSVWERKVKTSSSARQQDEDARFLWNASQGIELPYMDTMSKRKLMLKDKERLSFLLNKIGPALL